MLVGWRELHSWEWRTAGRVREEPKGDTADDPTWESRRSRVQKGITPLAVGGKKLHPNRSAGCHRELGEGKDSIRPGLWQGVYTRSV